MSSRKVSSKDSGKDESGGEERLCGQVEIIAESVRPVRKPADGGEAGHAPRMATANTANGYRNGSRKTALTASPPIQAASQTPSCRMSPNAQGDR